MEATVHPADPMGTTASVDGTPASGRPYWPALDGLRGTAILAVLVCHHSALIPNTHGLADLLDNGWAGVDLFFVLSGFLITGILFDAKGTPHYFRNFYARRSLRIFPLYYGFLAALLLLLLLVRFLPGNLGGGLDRLWAPQPWLWTYTANFWIGAQKQWTTSTESIIPLWSLSVEEQFYLIWPLVVFSFSRRKLIGICIGVMIGALLLRLMLTAHGIDWFALYTWTPTRADSLAAGGLLALLIRRPGGTRNLREIFNCAGAMAGLLLLVNCRGFDPLGHPWLRQIIYSLLAIFFAALLYWSIDPASLLGIPRRIYECPVLRIIGRYSYGIYIFHLPLMYLSRFALTRCGWYDPEHKSWPAALGLIALNAILTSAAAVISFEAYEKQFLKLKRRFPEPSLSRPPAAWEAGETG
ncbi:MAG TPA: acyltransferase [Tepidisphaeraceae bacterium]|nr:acyltransferase [Tepidisphaeraceae bacterium]